MRSFFLVLGLVMVTALGGCARPNPMAFAGQSDEPYRLGSGDRLRVIVFGQDTLSNSYAVDGSGRIAMPLIGLVPAQGMTTPQLASAIEGKLRNGYVREPKVSVEVEAYRPFFILGEVTTAGQYPYVSDMTVQNAVAIAGGFSPRASRSTADVTRVVNGRPVTATVPITELVRPGDTVTVRERFF